MILQLGLSSRALLLALSSGGYVTAAAAYPHDPSDFVRCENVLRAHGLREQLPRMAAAGPEWAGYVARWDEIAALIEQEVPGAYSGAEGRAPRAYQVMQDIRTQARP